MRLMRLSAVSAVLLLASTAEAGWPRSPSLVGGGPSVSLEAKTAAARALFSLSDATALEPTEVLLQDPERSVRMLAARRAELGRMSLRPEVLRTLLLGASPEENSMGLRLLRSELNSDLLRLVVKLTAAADVEVRRLAVLGLAYARKEDQPEALEVARRLLSDAEESVKLEAVFVVTRLGGANSVASLEGMLSDPSENVRVAALRARSLFEGARSLGKAFASDVSWRIRGAAYLCLFRAGDGDVLEEERLDSFAKEEDARVREGVLAVMSLTDAALVGRMVTKLAQHATEDDASYRNWVARLRAERGDADSILTRALGALRGESLARLTATLGEDLSRELSLAIQSAWSQGRLSTSVAGAALARGGARGAELPLRVLEALETAHSSEAEDLVRILQAQPGLPIPVLRQIRVLSSRKDWSESVRRGLVRLLVGSDEGAEIGRRMLGATVQGHRALGQVLLAARGDSDAIVRALSDYREGAAVLEELIVTLDRFPRPTLYDALPRLAPSQRLALLRHVRELPHSSEETLALRTLWPHLTEKERSATVSVVRFLPCDESREFLGELGRSAAFRVLVEPCENSLLALDASPQRGLQALGLQRLSQLELSEGARKRARSWLERELGQKGGEHWARLALLAAARELGGVHVPKEERTTEALDVFARMARRTEVDSSKELNILRGIASDLETSTYPGALRFSSGALRGESFRFCAILSVSEAVSRRCLVEESVPETSSSPNVRSDDSVLQLMGANGDRLGSMAVVVVDESGRPWVSYSDAEGRLPVRGRNALVLDSRLAY